MAKTKKCRHCLAEIPKKAKKCMHCGESQRGGALSGVAKAFVVVIAVFAFSTWYVSSGYYIQPEPERPKTPEQIAAEKEQAKIDRERSQARELCRNAIRLWAKYPSKLDFKIFGPPPQPMRGGGWIVDLDFEAMNSFGAMLPYRAYCEVKNGKLQNFKVTPR